MEHEVNNESGLNDFSSSSCLLYRDGGFHRNHRCDCCSMWYMTLKGRGKELVLTGS